MFLQISGVTAFSVKDSSARFHLRRISGKEHITLFQEITHSAIRQFFDFDNAASADIVNLYGIIEFHKFLLLSFQPMITCSALSLN
jgi:hypothetical protein